VSEIALFHGLAAQRLRERCRLAGVTLLFAVVIPYEVVDNSPQFLWQLIAELPAAGALAALAPMLAGAAILAASAFTKRGASLAVAVVAALVAAGVVFRLGADAAAWDVLPVPDSLAAHPTSAILALALTAAGANLAWKPRCRRVARGMLGAAAALVLLYYLRPSQGEAPLMTVGRFLGAIIDSPGFRLKLGFTLLVFIALAPAVITFAGARYAFTPPKREQPLIGVAAVFGPPAMLLALVYRSFFGAAVGAGILASIGTALLLCALLALLASAFEVLGEAAITPEADLEQPKGLALRRAAMIGAGAALLACAAQAVLARPPAKGVDWQLRAATPEGDKLFGELVPAWNDARIRWESRARADEGPRPRDELRGPPPSGDTKAAEQAPLAADLDAAAQAMLDAARPLDPGLGAALETLAREALDLHAAGRRFYQLIHEVNEASREAGLPYYLDPAVGLAQTKSGILRSLRVLSYRIERVHGVTAGSSRFATLHVRSISARRTSHARLGFSRDLQPFALVVLDETAPFELFLANMAAASPPTCGESADAAAQEGLLRCGEVLAALWAGAAPPSTEAGGAPGGLHPALIALTERHELQHQIDGPHLPIAAAVERHLAAASDNTKELVNRELSAYIAEITAEGAPPKLGLVHLVRFALANRGGAEHHVALIALAALRGHEVRRAARRTDPAEVTAAFVELAALDDVELRARAASAWRSLFGADLPAIKE
jgi:hypothetical protein